MWYNCSVNFKRGEGATNTPPRSNQTKGKFRMATSDSTTKIPYGYCQCGCGQKTPIAIKTNSRRGIEKGKPNRFLPNHHKGKPKQSLSERFWSKVANTANPEECWVWQAGISSGGYGSFKINDTSIAASRMAWELTYGVIPDGLWVLHKCDNRKCVNPNHLFLGTIDDNNQDKMNKGRQPSGELSPCHKLTVEQVKSIREKHKNGIASSRKLAKEYGVAPTTIFNIVSGKTWKCAL